MLNKSLFYLQRARPIVLLVVLAVASVSIVQGIQNAISFSQDYQWDVARLLLERTNPYTLFLTNDSSYTVPGMPDGLEPNQFPSLLVFILPYALLPFETSKWLWMLTNCICTAILLLLFRRWSPVLQSPYGFVLFSGALLASTAWRNLMGLGQHTIVALTFFLLSLHLFNRKKMFWSGLAYAFALLKYTTVLPLGLFFLYKRQPQPLIVAFVTHFILHIGFALWLEASPMQLIVQPLQVAAEVTNAQGYLDLSALAQHMGLNQTIPVLLSVVLGGLSIAIVIRNNPEIINRDVEILAYLALLSNIIVYHRSYDLITLIFLLILLISGKSIPKGLKLSGIMLLLFGWYGIRLFHQLELANSGLGLFFVAIMALIYYFTFAQMVRYLWKKPLVGSSPLAPPHW